MGHEYPGNNRKFGVFFAKFLKYFRKLGATPSLPQLLSLRDIPENIIRSAHMLEVTCIDSSFSYAGKGVREKARVAVGVSLVTIIH